MYKKIAAVFVISLPVAITLLICGIFLFSTPERQTQLWWKAGLSSEVPVSGEPVSMVAFTKNFDAWTKHPDTPVCRVFVRKETQSGRLFALPGWHAGSLRISLHYEGDAKKYVSCCWCEEFDIDGREIVRPGCQPPEGNLPVLPVMSRDGQVWVNLNGVLN